MNFSNLSKYSKRQEQPGGEYSRLRTLCLSGIILLSFYAITKFPGYYEAGLDVKSWMLIICTMLSGWTLLFVERTASSRSGRRSHDLGSRGGSLHTFSYGDHYCRKCSRHLIVAHQGKNGKVKIPVPGTAVEEGSSLKLYCPECKTVVTESGSLRKGFQSAKMKSRDYAKMGLKLKEMQAYRYNRDYVKRCVLIAVLMLMATSSCLYFARNQASFLLLPLAVGYLAFTSVYNMLTAVSSCFYATEYGIICSALWSISLYPIKDASALVRYDNTANKSWGFYSAKENLMLSPLIQNYTQLAGEVTALCQRNDVPVI